MAVVVVAPAVDLRVPFAVFGVYHIINVESPCVCIRDGCLVLGDYHSMQSARFTKDGSEDQSNS